MLTFFIPAPPVALSATVGDSSYEPDMNELMPVSAEVGVFMPHNTKATAD
jgi:hypothetical protein